MPERPEEKVGGDADGHKKEGNIEISKNLQVATAAVDSLGLCLFVAFAVLDDARGVPCMAKLVSGLTGKDFSVDDLVGMGVNCLKDELDFNKRAGFTDADDQLPRFPGRTAAPAQCRLGLLRCGNAGRQGLDFLLQHRPGVI